LQLQLAGFVVTFNARNRAVEASRDLVTGQQAVRWLRQVHKSTLYELGDMKSKKDANAKDKSQVAENIMVKNLIFIFLMLLCDFNMIVFLCDHD
jgi:hypothetical protein